MLKKAGFHAMNMLALLDGQRRVAVEIPQADSDAQGVDVLATAGAGHVSVLISRYAPPDQVFAKSLRRAGIASRAEIQISDDKLIAYAKRETELAPTDASPAVREALARARAATEQARDRLADEIVVKLQVESVGAATPYRIYRIDTGKLNPGRAYRDQRASGGTYQAGLTAARAQLAFAPESSGTGPAPQLRLPTYAVVLVVFDVAGLN